MRVVSFRLQNFRSFVDSGIVNLSRVNVFIGANNSGKSSVLRGLHQLQRGLHDQYGDVRIGATEARIDIDLADVQNPQWPSTDTQAVFSAHLSSTERRTGSMFTYLTVNDVKVSQGDIQLPNQEPNHFILPYLSRRKTGTYGEDIREQNVTTIAADMSNLSAKLSRLANPHFPAYTKYAAACQEILGFVVTAIPSLNGQHPGIYLPDQTSMPISQMGEGVPNIVYLLANLVTATGKLFLIEEPENDLHPRALKALLDLIVQSSSNQFVISTHSNIVVSHLCSAPDSKLFKVSSQFGTLPTTARIEEAPNNPRARVEILRELGYAFSDFDLWDGWLLLEESSAERIVRDYLIPWFAPGLSSIRTMAAGGIDNVEPTFDDLRRLVLFTHLQPAYEGRTWVRVDGDEVGMNIVNKLRIKYPSIDSDHFQAFDQPQFEHYYPEPFREEVAATLAISDGPARRKAKRNLLLDVLEWINSDVERAKTALCTSAMSVIEDLRSIETQLRLANRL